MREIDFKDTEAKYPMIIPKAWYSVIRWQQNLSKGLNLELGSWRNLLVCLCLSLQHFPSFFQNMYSPCSSFYTEQVKEDYPPSLKKLYKTELEFPHPNSNYPRMVISFIQLKSGVNTKLIQPCLIGDQLKVRKQEDGAWQVEMKLLKCLL